MLSGTKRLFLDMFLLHVSRNNYLTANIVLGTKNKDQMMIMTGMVQGLVIIAPQILNIGC
jgi:hypothetical protein